MALEGRRLTTTKVPVDKQSKDREYQTPSGLLGPVQSYFPGGVIPLDPLSTKDNPTKALDWCYPGGADGYLLAWHVFDGVYVNPPFGRAAIEKIGLEASLGCEMIALLPTNRSETDYFQRCIVERASVVCHIRRRVAFIRPSTGRPADQNVYCSQLWGFNVDVSRFAQALGVLGVCVKQEVVARTPSVLVKWNPEFERPRSRSRPK